MFRLLATAGGRPVIIETVGSPGAVQHRLALPSGQAESVVDQLRAVLPGLSVEALPERPALVATRAATLRLSTRQRPLRTDDLAAVNRAVLTALAHLHKGEHLALQWMLGRALAPAAVPNHASGLAYESWLGALLLAPFGPPPVVDAEARNALRSKQAEPGWQLTGRVAVQAGSANRERQLIRQVAGALATSAAPGVGWRLHSVSPAQVHNARLPWRLPLRLNAVELAAVSAFPVSVTGELPVDRLGSRLVAPSTAIPRKGRVIGEASFPGRERPLALSATDSLRHLHALGPTGVGKSTLLLNLITQDMAAGRAVVVIEPKGDLIADVLARIPAARIGDVVLLDPTDTQRPVGLNPLQLNGRSPELAADQLLGLFHSLYAQSWGTRTHDILGASLLTLARTPGMSLAALPLLLTDTGFRRRIVSKVADPIGLGPFWSAYEAWSEQQRVEAIAPTLNKLRPLLLRPEMRAIVGQADGGFDLRRQRVLARLCRERLLIALTRRIGGVRAGSAGLVMAIGPAGQRVIGLDGIRRRAYEPSWRFVDHTLAIAQLVVDVNVAARAGLLDVLDAQAEPQCWRTVAGMGGRLVLRPDAFLTLGVGEYELRWFIEVDRSSESLPVIVRKCRLYADYYQSGQEQAAHGGVFPRVCWIVPDDTRAERVRAAIAQDRTLPKRLFVVTTNEGALLTLTTWADKRTEVTA